MHSKKKNFIISIVIIGIVVVLVFIAGTFYRFQDQHAITKQSLKSTLSSLEEISSIAYDYSRVGRFDDSLGVENWKNQNPKGYFLMTYRGEMKVGVHPDQAKITISDKKITIDIGKIKVLSHHINQDSLEIYDESANVFTKAKLKDYSKFQSSQKKQVEDEEKVKGTYNKAAGKIREQISTALQVNDTIREEYHLEVIIGK